MLTLNQYILLDPILLCFMTASVLGMVKLSKATHSGENFSRKWWYWLFFTGTMLACTISVKFVGLFVVLLVGLHTINDLWIVLGDLAKPVVSIMCAFLEQQQNISGHTCFHLNHFLLFHNYKKRNSFRKNQNAHTFNNYFLLFFFLFVVVTLTNRTYDIKRVFNIRQ